MAMRDAKAKLVCRYESTQCWVSNCPNETPQTICRTALSPISQIDADRIALQAAKDAAIALCPPDPPLSFESTKQFTAQCAEGTVGIPITRTRTATSSVSQEDADAKALTAATLAANAALVCSPVQPPDEFIGVSVTVSYIEGESPQHQCNAAVFDVTANGVFLGTANLNNEEDGGSRSGGPYVLTPEQVEQMDTIDGYLRLSFACNVSMIDLSYDNGNCHEGVGRVVVLSNTGALLYDGYPSGTFLEIPVTA
jgi:hypothetical protein